MEKQFSVISSQFSVVRIGRCLRPAVYTTQMDLARNSAVRVIRESGPMGHGFLRHHGRTESPRTVRRPYTYITPQVIARAGGEERSGEKKGRRDEGTKGQRGGGRNQGIEGSRRFGLWIWVRLGCDAKARGLVGRLSALPDRKVASGIGESVPHPDGRPCGSAKREGHPQGRIANLEWRIAKGRTPRQVRHAEFAIRYSFSRVMLVGPHGRPYGQPVRPVDPTAIAR